MTVLNQLLKYEFYTFSVLATKGLKVKYLFLWGHEISKYQFLKFLI